MQLDLGLNLGIRSSTSIWTPAELPNLALWLDAADASTITLNGSNVSQWNDKSGNNYHLSQATAESQPLYEATGLLGKPTLNNLDGRLLQRGTTNILRNVDGATIISVCQFTTPLVGAIDNGMAVFVNNGAVAGATRFGLTPMPSPGTLGTYSAAGRRLDSNSFAAVSSPTSLTAEPVIWMGNADYANAQVNSWLNGRTDIVNAAFQTAGSTSDTDSLGIALFSRPNGGLDVYDNTRISEVLIVNTTLSTDDRERVEGYLAHKWGLVADLPAGHPYKTTPPTV